VCWGYCLAGRSIHNEDDWRPGIGGGVSHGWFRVLYLVQEFGLFYIFILFKMYTPPLRLQAYKNLKTIRLKHKLPKRITKASIN